MKKKLLLADDSITIQKVVGIIFATEDYELLTVSDGDKALELALTHHPDLVIADIIMPGKDGFELCRAIKSHPALATTSVLLLPGAFEEFDETRAVEVCADGWLTKPFESQALIDKVAALFEMPPLRLVAAEEAEEVAEEVADLPLESEEEDFFAVEEPLHEVVETVADEVATVEDSDKELWGEVSFEEEDLKPQQLLANGDQDEDESLELAAEDDDLYEMPQELTAEQLAPYVSAPITPAPPQEDQGTPDFEPLSVETGQEFEFIGDQSDDEDHALIEEPESTGAEHMAEPGAPSFMFGAQDSIEDDSHSALTSEESDEVLELMEEDLEQEEELVEDSATFIDLSAADEDVVAETPADTFAPLTEDEEFEADDQILDLTEGDVLEDEEVRVAAPEEMPSVEAPDSESDDLYGESFEPLGEEDETTEVSFGRRDDELFSDDVEKVSAATAAVDFAGSAEQAEFEAETDVEELVETEPEEVVEPQIMAEQEEIEEPEEAAAQTDSFEDSAVPPALVATGAALSAATVEEQLRQLPEEEIAQIIEKVAGPLIERLAREMLEQVVWEVVPDLAETMIRTEIEKIKRGEV